MKIKKRKPEDIQTERYLIIAFIVSDSVCRQLYKTYKKEFFQSKATQEISQWCIDFFKEYDSSPQQEIDSIFEMKSKSGKIPPDLEDEISNFLSSIADEFDSWQDLNVQFYVDLGIKYFKKRSFFLLGDQIKEAAESDSIENAESIYADFSKVREQLSESRNILSNEGIEKFYHSVESHPPILLELPGALGQLVGPIERESFIGILGREKVGKTYALMIFAIAAARKGLNVAVIETGDLTQDQIGRRFYSYLTKKPAREKHLNPNHMTPVLDCLYNQMGDCEHGKSTEIVSDRDEEGKPKFCVDITDKDTLDSHERCIECWKDRYSRYNHKKFKGSIWWEENPLNDIWHPNEVRKAANKFHKRFKGQIVTEAFPMYEAKASDIRDWCINKQKDEGFIPDILIVDYPDILAPERNAEYRHQENEKWMILRKISQEFHNCVIVATQADAKSYNADTLQLSNYSEDKRKYSHVTHFFGINKTKAEERLGCLRFNTLLLREDSIKIVNQVSILQDLAISNPNKGSFFGRIPFFNPNT